MIMAQEDTIAAIATPIGEGGIAVIRVSGPDALAVADLGFRGKQKLSTVLTHTAHVGFFYDRTNEVIDEVIATVFRKPHSYTTEDVVEISCHGGIYITKKILGEIIMAGARMALPGEFTQRAFINGRIDLSQAEAVADLIKSHSELSHKTSIQQLHGRISHEIATLREKILNICSLLELELDFSEEGIEFKGRTVLVEEIQEIINTVDQMLSTYKVGKIYREGARIVIAGRPNAGKSSILNALINEDRSIVTNVAGTTRDIILESLIIEGVLFNIIDTADYVKAKILFEKQGIKRTEQEINKADIFSL